jgi:hypothetical protein
MTPTPPSNQTSEIYHDRAKEDYSQSAAFLKSGCQIVFTGNGGAALALLTFLTAIAKDQTSAIGLSTLLPGFALAATIYLAGVLLAAVALVTFSVSREKWGHFWEDNALTGAVDFQKRVARSGGRFRNLGYGLFLASAAAFVAGSLVAVRVFLR